MNRELTKDADMNVFALCTGRCGSVTFIRACNHATNYTAEHESRTGVVGPSRLAYPDQHIEADNRLSWMLGRLDDAYGDDAFYVHLTRDRAETAESFRKRYDQGIIKAYREQILLKSPADVDPLEVCFDYCSTVTRNIERFLKDKTKCMSISLETAQADFQEFWNRIGATGSLTNALAEYATAHNASNTDTPHPSRGTRLWHRQTRPGFFQRLRL